MAHAGLKTYDDSAAHGLARRWMTLFLMWKAGGYDSGGRVKGFGWMMHIPTFE